MKIFSLINQKLNGVLLYRSVIPHSYMLGRYDVEIHFSDLLSLKLMKDKDLSEFDIIHVSYTAWDEEDTERIKKLGVKLIIDVDDYWVLDRFHESYNRYKEYNRSEQIVRIIEGADFITTTTIELASMIKVYNSNIGIFKNALMEDDYIHPIPNKIPMAAWIGSSQHTADLMMIQHLQKGFSIPIYIPEVYRQVFKDKFLYFQGQEIPNYLGLYNEYEIILSTLRKSKFNKYKSPLKVMEAGMFSKALIISDVDPFSPYLKHKENCLAVRKKSEWGKWLKMFYNDAAMRKELGDNLNKMVLKEFNLKEITKRRFEFYKKVLGTADNKK